ncbi:DUF4123 domain-containing protein [Pseudomonas tensinigenes]|uniref:DUF4123 domain-containing protein n=1 Tax=Pseudomonas tensinigenes TaxID=2745511 RepID=A0ABX8Q0E0_9PSED|nr:DUF4123 domain-containing protein [Pseudomonas tensinigenes]QXI06736.1 DUF4123 domain-containing protein [Pseudomonas tensinigenes]
MQPDFLLPADWLAREPLKTSEQLFAVFSNANEAKPPVAWRDTASPIWAETIYAEWDAVMPYVGIVATDSEFLHWVTTTESQDWGWLAVSSASLEEVVAHFRSLTQVLMPGGKTVFFRFWDGRFLLPILQANEVDAAQLFPLIERCLINGQALEIGGRAQVSGRVFPWWQVPESVLAQQGYDVRTANALQWLSEEHPAVFEAFPEAILRCKVRRFFQVSMSEESSQSALLAFLLAESE